MYTHGLFSQQWNCLRNAITVFQHLKFILAAPLLIQFHFTTFIADRVFISPIPSNQFMLSSSENIYLIYDRYCPFTLFSNFFILQVFRKLASSQHMWIYILRLQSFLLLTCFLVSFFSLLYCM